MKTMKQEGNFGLFCRKDQDKKISWLVHPPPPEKKKAQKLSGHLTPLEGAGTSLSGDVSVEGDMDPK